jgi:hypothetical protein
MAAKNEQVNREAVVEAWDRWLFHNGISVAEIIEHAVEKAVGKWLDAHGEEVIGKAAQKSTNAWFMLYEDQVIPALAEILQQKLREEPK